MGLYDQYQQAQTPYMSQFVGSAVPELNQYAATINQRYNEAQDQDDMLAEALGNLHHLNFGADAQYANELKQQYYKKLQDRSARGDFENMGRRTRMDAMRFAQAYQPLIQRQQDMSELIKKISDDPNIADPATKQALIEKAMHQNSMQQDPSTGDYMRDQNGRIMLGGVQNMSYAPDTDISKEINDNLAHKEADVRNGNFYKDGHGNLIKTVEQVRTKEHMAELANEVMQSSPKIKAMLARDADLATYKLTPEQVKQELAGRKLDRSAYQVLKGTGMNEHEVQSHLKSMYGNSNDGMVSPLDAQKAQLMQQGYSEAAAEKAILSKRIIQEKMAPYSNLAGDVYQVDKQSTESMVDHIGNMKVAQALANIKDPNVIAMQGTTSTTSQEDPAATAQQHAAAVEDLQHNAQSVQSAILAGLKATGLTTGNPKQDMTTAIAMMHNPVKLNALKVALARKDPNAAQVLESVAGDYTNKAAVVEAQSSHLGDIEKAGGWNLDEAYKKYREAKGKQIWSTTPLSKADFLNAVRKNETATLGDFATSNAVSSYRDNLNKGIKAMNDGTAQAAGYTTLEPTGSGKTKELTDAVTDLVLRNGVTGVDLNSGDTKSVDIATAMGIKPGVDAKTRAAENGLTVRFNTEGVNGKPTLTVRTADGKTKIFQAQNLPPSIQDELNLQLVKSGASASTSAYGKTLLSQGMIGFGSSRSTDITPQYLKTVNPGASGVIKKLNDDYSVKVTDAGAGHRKFQLYYTKADGSTVPTKHVYDSVDDLYRTLGFQGYKEVTDARDQQQLDRQR